MHQRRFRISSRPTLAFQLKEEKGKRKGRGKSFGSWKNKVKYSLYLGYPDDFAAAGKEKLKKEE